MSFLLCRLGKLNDLPVYLDICLPTGRQHLRSAPRPEVLEYSTAWSPVVTWWWLVVSPRRRRDHGPWPVKIRRSREIAEGLKQEAAKGFIRLAVNVKSQP